eukprot:gene8616-5049_t
MGESPAAADAAAAACADGAARWRVDASRAELIGELAQRTANMNADTLRKDLNVSSQNLLYVGKKYLSRPNTATLKRNFMRYDPPFNTSPCHGVTVIVNHFSKAPATTNQHILACNHRETNHRR